MGFLVASLCISAKITVDHLSGFVVLVSGSFSVEELDRGLLTVSSNN